MQALLTSSAAPAALRAARLAALTAILGLASPALAAGALALPFGIPGHGRVVLDIPSDFCAHAEPADEPPSTGIRLEPLQGSAFLVKVVVFAAPKKPTPELVRAGVESMAKDMKPSALEQSLPVEERAGPTRLLFYTATDKKFANRAPPDGEWKVVTQGAGAVGDLNLVFTILSNAKNAPERLRALEMLSSARWLADGTGPSAVRVTASGKALVAELPGFEALKLEATPDGKRMAIVGQIGKLAVRLVAEEAAKDVVKPEQVREARWTNGAAKVLTEATGVKLSSQNGMALVEYMIPRVKDVEVRQRNLVGYLAGSGLAGEVHVSKVAYVPADAAALEKVLSSVRIE